MMEASNLIQILPQVPVLIVLLFGIIIAVIRWNSHPRVSLFAVLGLGLLLLLGIFGIALNYIPLILHTRGWPIARVMNILGVGNLILSLLRVGGWLLVLAAIFSNRRDPAVQV